MEKKRRLTIKQQKRVEKTLETGNATEAAAQVYDVSNRNTARVIGGENLLKPALQDEMAERLAKAKSMIYSLSQASENERIRLDASKDVVDRLEGKPLQRIETKQDEDQFKKTLVFKENITIQELEEMRKKYL